MEQKLNYFMERTDKSFDRLDRKIDALDTKLDAIKEENVFNKGKTYGIVIVLTLIFNLIIMYFKK